MAEDITLTGTFEDIADAIREKGISGTMKATEMPGKIRQIVQIDPEDYYTKAQTSSAAELSAAFADCALTSQIPTSVSQLDNDSGYIDSQAVQGMLESYYQKSETSSASELSAAFANVSVEVDPQLRTDIDSKVLVNEVSAQSLKINIMALSDYQEISGTAAFDPTAFYCISNDTAGGGGGGGDMSNYYTKAQTSSAVELSSAFANVSVDLTDYATLTQLSSKVIVNEVSADLKIQIMSKADYDVLSAGGTTDPDTFYCLSDWQPGGDMTDYYTKSETSSAAEISEALGDINTVLEALN